MLLNIWIPPPPPPPPPPHTHTKKINTTIDLLVPNTTLFTHWNFFDINPYKWFYFPSSFFRYQGVLSRRVIRSSRLRMGGGGGGGIPDFVSLHLDTVPQAVTCISFCCWDMKCTADMGMVSRILSRMVFLMDEFFKIVFVRDRMR